MPWESIGSIDTGNMPWDEDWIRFSLDLARRYIVYVCGRPPAGCELEIMSNEHDLGEYLTIGIWSEYILPSGCVQDCENALSVFDTAVDWLKLKGYYYGREERRLADEEVDEDGDT